MTEFIESGGFTLFDAIVALLMVFSGLMALARGFIRELASVAAFVIAVTAAFFAYIYLTPLAIEFMPDSWSHFIAEGLVLLIAFLFVYILAAWVGRKFSKFVHANTDISLIDRLAGQQAAGRLPPFPSPLRPEIAQPFSRPDSAIRLQAAGSVDEFTQ